MRGGNALPSPPAAHPVNTAFVNPRDPPRMGSVSRMLGFWANFAAGGDPNGAPLPVWPRYEARGARRIGLLAGGAGDPWGPPFPRTTLGLVGPTENDRGPVAPSRSAGTTAAIRPSAGR